MEGPATRAIGESVKYLLLNCRKKEAGSYASLLFPLQKSQSSFLFTLGRIKINAIEERQPALKPQGPQMMQVQVLFAKEER